MFLISISWDLLNRMLFYGSYSMIRTLTNTDNHLSIILEVYGSNNEGSVNSVACSLLTYSLIVAYEVYVYADKKTFVHMLYNGIIYAI